ncbi:hypothetical protein [Longivirga aurantiaca]|uniref:Uncharacterized protein n=1 Tax=Longivirga aurantiaca TaxID=1837743 RepID=A0ABW1SYD4_9ACTN
MGYFWYVLVGLVLLGLSGLMLYALVTERGDWLNRLWMPFPWENTNGGRGPRSTEFSALVVGVVFGVIGFLVLTYVALSFLL